MGRFSFKRKSNVNIGRVVSKIAITLISLWAGGTILTVLGDTMYCTYSPFYTGLSLIGWSVSSVDFGNHVCNLTSVGITGTKAGTITATSGVGILGVIGLIAIASIIMEFVQIRMG